MFNPLTPYLSRLPSVYPLPTPTPYPHPSLTQSFHTRTHTFSPHPPHLPSWQGIVSQYQQYDHNNGKIVTFGSNEGRPMSDNWNPSGVMTNSAYTAVIHACHTVSKWQDLVRALRVRLSFVHYCGCYACACL